MIRPAAALVLMTAAALADAVAFVDGEKTGEHLASADAAGTVLLGGDGNRTVPTSRIVEASFEPSAEAPSGPINLFLSNGDEIRGTVRGEEGHVLLDGAGVAGLRVPLARVRAVCFGRLMGAAQARYAEVFAEELARGRDVVVVQKGTRPFVVAGRVLSFDEKELVVRVGDERHGLARHKVYGFVRVADPPAEEAAAISVRVHILGGARLTLPLAGITADAVEGGGARVDRAYVTRVAFTGGHMAHLSDFEPIAVDQTALFGRAPAWRRDAMVHGGPLLIAGTSYSRGLGVQAYSRLEFVLNKRWESFFVRCGIDDAAGAEGDALFRVLGDGKVLTEVRRRRGDEPKKLLLDARGVERLVLEAAPGDSYTSDFCDWAEARVFNAGRE